MKGSNFQSRPAGEGCASREALTLLLAHSSSSLLSLSLSSSVAYLDARSEHHERLLEMRETMNDDEQALAPLDVMKIGQLISIFAGSSSWRHCMCTRKQVIVYVCEVKRENRGRHESMRKTSR